MPDYSQMAQLDEIKRELRRQSVLLEQLLALHQQAPATAASAPEPSLLRRAVRWLRGA